MRKEVILVAKSKKGSSKIGALRDRVGRTQRELSLLVGVTENTIQNWENGRSLVEQIKRLILLCKALDCKLEDLIDEVPELDEKVLELLGDKPSQVSKN